MNLEFPEGACVMGTVGPLAQILLIGSGRPRESVSSTNTQLTLMQTRVKEDKTCWVTWAALVTHVKSLGLEHSHCICTNEDQGEGRARCPTGLPPGAAASPERRCMWEAQVTVELSPHRQVGSQEENVILQIFPLPFLKSVPHHVHCVPFLKGFRQVPCGMRMGIRSRPPGAAPYDERGLFRTENLMKVNSFDNQNRASKIHIL